MFQPQTLAHFLHITINILLLQRKNPLNQNNKSCLDMVANPYKEMDWKKNIEESIEDYLNATGELLEWFFLR